MLYLKYRPQKLSEIDSEEIRDQLKGILKGEKLAHALLLTGPKGTGKTSSGRILAKAINCDNNFFASKDAAIEPCNRCSSCRTITAGTATHVFELDAASNRKIDDIRELISTVSFTPVSGRYKVYIIDEVHMLTPEAESALLKTLEEPPNHAIFILATTEPDKIAPTIRSRCLIIHFKKASEEQIVGMLKRIAKAEKIKVDEVVLKLIAKHADSSYRDGVKLFETAMLSKSLSIKGVEKLLGTISSDADFLLYLQEKDQLAALKFLKSFESQGGSFKVLLEQTLDRLHQILLAKNGVNLKTKVDYQLNNKQISLLMRLCTQAWNDLKISPIEAIPLEIVVVEYCESEL